MQRSCLSKELSFKGAVLQRGCLAIKPRFMLEQRVPVKVYAEAESSSQGLCWSRRVPAKVYVGAGEFQPRFMLEQESSSQDLCWSRRVPAKVYVGTGEFQPRFMLEQESSNLIKNLKEINGFLTRQVSPLLLV